MPPASVRLVMGADRRALWLLRPPPLARGQQVGQTPVAAQPYPSGHGIIEWDTAARIVGRRFRRPWSVAPTVVGIRI